MTRKPARQIRAEIDDHLRSALDSPVAARSLDREIDQALRSGEGFAPEGGRRVPGGDPLEIVTRAVSEVGSSGRFGDRKVFISELHDRAGRQVGMDLPAFKQWLVVQHQAGRLVLARADLVAAMDPDLVARSEARADGATFHFVVDPAVGRRRGADLAGRAVDSTPGSGRDVASAPRASARRQWEDLVASGSKSPQAWEDAASRLRSEAIQATEAYRSALLDRAEMAEQRALRLRRGS